MALKTRQKTHFDDSIVYDTLSVLPFTTVTVPANANTNTASGSVILPVSCKIYSASICITSPNNGVTAFNVCANFVNEVGPGIPDTSDSYTITEPGGVSGGYPPVVATSGTTLFSSDQPVTITSSGGVQTFPVPAPLYDVIWPQGMPLTMRLATGATVAGLILVSLLIKPYDITPYLPRNTNLNPATDIK